MKKPVVLVVLDGWGYREDTRHNAIANAQTPFFDLLWQTFPHALLDASGESVGLPAGQMGNSEVGHMTMGAGKPIDTDLVRINKALRSQELEHNTALNDLFTHVKQHNATLHIGGLLSPGGIHSHQDHLYAFIRQAKMSGIDDIVIHVFTDGRDTPPMSAAGFVAELETLLEDLGVGHIATVAGRFYPMDRDRNWDRLARAEAALFHGTITPSKHKKPSAAIAELYASSVVDEHIEPMVFADTDGKIRTLQKNDGFLFYNFRSDRARMLTEKLLARRKSDNLHVVTLTQYDATFDCPVVFPPIKVTTTLAGEIAQAGLRQAHVAETEKYAHATYFLNVGREQLYEQEKHVLVKSRSDITTYDQAPEMMAKEIVDAALPHLEDGTEFLFLNFANADMVGHTANYSAILQALAAVDRELQRLFTAVEKRGGVVCITADHGNAETNIDPVTGDKHTAHTTNPVPMIITDKSLILRSFGTLADVAPTILELLGLPKPLEMTGQSLIQG